MSKEFLIRKGSYFGSQAARSVLAVDDVSFEIARGECLGLVGESGCGKTTTSKMIMRALSTDSGAVTFYDGGEHGGHHADGDQLVELGPEQDRVTGDVVHIVPGEGHLPGLERGGVKHQHRPAHDCGDPRQLHVARIEAQGPQRDEDEDIEQRRRLQIEGRRLLVGAVERPDQHHQQEHVGDHRQGEEPARQPRPAARPEAQHGEDEIPPEDPRRELEGQFRVAAVRGQQE
ncbi:MAG: ATP-binding cassette domain-containing protein [Rhodospirillaceae bacterium]